MEAFIKNEQIFIGNLDLIHYNHSIPTCIDEIKEDVFTPFVVFEQCSNYPILHGVMAANADEALQEVFNLLIESADDVSDIETIELNVEKLTFKNLLA